MGLMGFVHCSSPDLPFTRLQGACALSLQNLDSNQSVSCSKAQTPNSFSGRFLELSTLSTGKLDSLLFCPTHHIPPPGKERGRRLPHIDVQMGEREAPWQEGGGWVCRADGQATCHQPSCVGAPPCRPCEVPCVYSWAWPMCGAVPGPGGRGSRKAWCCWVGGKGPEPVGLGLP